MNLHNYEWYRRLRGGWYILDFISYRHTKRIESDPVIGNVIFANIELENIYVAYYGGLFKKPRLRIRANT